MDYSYRVIEVSDEQLIMMSLEEYNEMQNKLEEFDGIEGYILKMTGTSLECSDYIFNKGKDTTIAF